MKLSSDITVLPKDEAGWKTLLSLIPNYDCFRDAAEGDYFDHEAAERAIGFFHDCIKHVKAEKAGQPFLLERWQQAIVACLFGWKRADGSRRYRRMFLYIPRRNGKTCWMAGICLYVLTCDGEKGAEIYSAASDRDQASLIFEHAKGMVLQEPELSKRLRVYKGIGQRAIAYEAMGSSYKVIDSVPEGAHGYNTHLAAIDELHTQRNRFLVDVLETSTGSRHQPLICLVTTADFERKSICNETHDYAHSVLDGRIKDREFLPIVYEASIDDDWTDETVWVACNPNLGVSITLDYMRSACKRAQEEPSFENTFKRLHLNIRTEQDERWLPIEMWDKNSGLTAGETPTQWRERMLVECEGKHCVGGLDLAATVDVSAFVLAFRDGDGVILLPWFWIPGDNARDREKRDRVPYTEWSRGEWLTMTEGNVTDFDIIRRDINNIGKKYNIADLGFDRWGAAQIQTQLAGDGFDVVQFGQGFSSMSAPTNELQRLLAGGKIKHGGNPVLRWMAGNVAIERDAADNIKPSKKKSTEKIDGIVASIMAIGRLMVAPEKKSSVYATRGFLTL